jgi:hypothetical protein
VVALAAVMVLPRGDVASVERSARVADETQDQPGATPTVFVAAIEPRSTPQLADNAYVLLQRRVLTEGLDALPIAPSGSGGAMPARPTADNHRAAPWRRLLNGDPS